MQYPDFSNALLMQYETPLPDDFDMASIRARVREKAQVFDALPGMFVKFYALNEATTSPLNEYSSIYLWSQPSFLSRLFTGDFFENYAETFARPTPHWALVQHVSGDFGRLKQVKAAIRQTIGIPRKTHIGQFVKRWEQRASELLFRVIALDPTRWELIDFQFATERIGHPSGVNAHVYDIVHVSLPRVEAKLRS
jgi:Domain of unknown function (DUF4865)